jgi:cell division protein FtsQ
LAIPDGPPYKQEMVEGAPVDSATAITRRTPSRRRRTRSGFFKRLLWRKQKVRKSTATVDSGGDSALQLTRPSSLFRRTASGLRTENAVAQQPRTLGLFGRQRNRRVIGRSGTTGAFRAVTDPAERRRILRVALTSFLVVAVACGVAVGAVSAHRWLTRSPKFAIREVRVNATQHLTAEAIRARSGITLGTNLFSVSLGDAKARLAADPWVASVKVRRELPAFVTIELVERQAACVVALNHLYLADARGEVFKRASPDEATEFPVITGVPRDGYIDDRAASQALIREGLAAHALWRSKDRPPVGEIHVDAASGVTLYLKADGVALRIGRGDAAMLSSRLERLDSVLRALAEAGSHPRSILVDQKTHPNRVVVSLAQD